MEVLPKLYIVAKVASLWISKQWLYRLQGWIFFFFPTLVEKSISVKKKKSQWSLYFVPY